MSDRPREFEAVRVVMHFVAHAYLTSSEALAFLHLCTCASVNGTGKVCFQSMAQAMHRKKPETCRGYARRLRRLGLISGRFSLHDGYFRFKVNLPVEICAPLYDPQNNPPADAKSAPSNLALDPNASAV